MTNLVGSPRYYYPNKMGRIILLGIEEILGQNGLNAVLNLSKLSYFIDNFPPNTLDMQIRFDDLSLMMATLEEMYGPRGGQGLALRTGRACFKYGLREFGPMLGLTDMAFRLLPLNEKISEGLKIFAKTMNEFSDQRVRVDADEEHFYWHIDRCPMCWRRHSEEPVCHLLVGLLQEGLYWLSNGRFFCIEETNCIAKGDESCTIMIDKSPIE